MSDTFYLLMALTLQYRPFRVLTCLDTDVGHSRHQTGLLNSFIDTNLIHKFLYKLHKIKFLYMFRASSAYPQEVNVVNPYVTNVIYIWSTHS